MFHTPTQTLLIYGVLVFLCFLFHSISCEGEEMRSHYSCGPNLFFSIYSQREPVRDTLGDMWSPELLAPTQT